MAADTPEGAGEPDRRQSVVQVIHSFIGGGLEVMSANLARDLNARGLRAILVGLHGGGVLEGQLRENRIEHHVVSDVNYRDPRSHLRLARLFRSVRARVVHTHHFVSLANSLVAAKMAGVERIVHTDHSFQYLESRGDLRRALAWMSRWIDSFVVVGQAMERYYSETVGVDPRRLHVITNGVDLVRFRPRERRALRRSLGLPEGAMLVGTVGRFAAVKNYGLLIRAAAAARQVHGDLQLVLVGDGEERPMLEALAAEVGLGDAAHFLGWRRDVPEVLAALDLFALSSVSEGLPLVVLEAMASGVPIASTDVGDLPHVVAVGETGFLYPSGDAAALADILARLAADPRARRDMGCAARRAVERRYDQRTMVSRYLALYGEC